ncbi:MAG: hypothetical protein JWN86_3127 [Planctomycetota bacterium]|nr:hypothetical protein [Planctomycetota bacterium]
MATPMNHSGRLSRRLSGRGRWVMLAMIALLPVSLSLGDPGGQSSGVHFYSTAAPPMDYPGPEPVSPTEEFAEPEIAKPRTIAEPTLPVNQVAPTRIASIDTAAPKAARMPTPTETPLPPAAPDLIAEAKAAIASCKKTYASLQDYTCAFYKRERIEGQLSSHHHMQMKARTKPHSVYFKFVKPTAGREAIYIAGGYGGKALVHDVGIGKLLAGTLKVDPRGSMAMDGNLHPITEAGLGHMIDTILNAWHKELRHGESLVIMHHNAKVGNRTCLMIESVHPKKQPGFLFHMVKVYVDLELNLPIRFEAYDWPRNGRPAELVEEYTYSNLKVNVGLTNRDFDPSNSSYSFGRF